MKDVDEAYRAFWKWWQSLPADEMRDRHFGREAVAFGARWFALFAKTETGVSTCSCLERLVEIEETLLRCE